MSKGEGGQSEIVSSGDPVRAFATTVIVFIPWTDPVGNPSPLARLCPSCQTPSVIGHGWRNRQAHDPSHSLIRIHRGICNRCRLTLTFLPPWAIPHAHYSLLARQQAAVLASSPNRPLELCIPICADKDRSPDPSTVRRWLLRRTQSLWISLLGEWFSSPTLLAWDWKAASRILIPEINSA